MHLDLDDFVHVDSFGYFLTRGIGGGYIRACTSVLSQTGERFMIVYRDGLGALYIMSHVVTLQSAVSVFMAILKQNSRCFPRSDYIRCISSNDI